MVRRREARGGRLDADWEDCALQQPRARDVPLQLKRQLSQLLFGIFTNSRGKPDACRRKAEPSAAVINILIESQLTLVLCGSTRVSRTWTHAIKRCRTRYGFSLLLRAKVERAAHSRCHRTQSRDTLQSIGCAVMNSIGHYQEQKPRIATHVRTDHILQGTCESNVQSMLAGTTQARAWLTLSMHTRSISKGYDYEAESVVWSHLFNGSRGREWLRQTSRYRRPQQR